MPAMEPTPHGRAWQHRLGESLDTLIRQRGRPHNRRVVVPQPFSSSDPMEKRRRERKGVPSKVTRVHAASDADHADSAARLGQLGESYGVSACAW